MHLLLYIIMFLFKYLTCNKRLNEWRLDEYYVSVAFNVFTVL